MPSAAPSIRSSSDLVALIRRVGAPLSGEIPALADWLETHGVSAELVPYVDVRETDEVHPSASEDAPALIAALPHDCVIAQTVAICAFPTERPGFMSRTIACSYYEGYRREDSGDDYALLSRVFSYLPPTSEFWFGLSAIHAAHMARASPAPARQTPGGYASYIREMSARADQAYFLLGRVINARVGGALFDLIGMFKGHEVDACTEFLEREFGPRLPDPEDAVARRALLRHIVEARLAPNSRITLLTA